MNPASAFAPLRLSLSASRGASRHVLSLPYPPPQRLVREGGSVVKGPGLSFLGSPARLRGNSGHLGGYVLDDRGWQMELPWMTFVFFGLPFASAFASGAMSVCGFILVRDHKTRFPGKTAVRPFPGCIFTAWHDAPFRFGPVCRGPRGHSTARPANRDLRVYSIGRPLSYRRAALSPSAP